MLSVSLSLSAKVVAREFLAKDRVTACWEGVGGGEKRDYAMRASAVRVGCVPVSIQRPVRRFVSLERDG